MPFFLSSKSPAKTARPKLVVPDKTKAPSAPAGGGSGVAWAWLLLGLLLCAGLGAGWVYGVRALRAQLTALHPVPTGAKAIRMDAFRGAPWVTERDVADLTQEMGKLLTDDPLDGACLAAVAHRLEQHLAIQKVLEVSRDADGLVQIKAWCYQPAGLVAGGGKLLPVDGEGHPLSAEGLEPDAAAKLQIPVIEGVRSSSPWGKTVWKDAGLQAALQLVLRLSEAERFDLRRLTLGSEPAPGGRTRTTLALRFEPRGMAPFEVFWGLSVGEEKGVDAPAEDKLRAMRTLYARPELLKTPAPGAAPASFSVRSGSPKQLGASEPIPPPPPRPAGKTRTP